MLKGSLVALITPFKGDAVDEKGFQKFVDWQIRQGTHGVIPVGTAWNRAFATGLAGSNPYDGFPDSQLNLWASDNHHASVFGSYLEALVVFGKITGRDPE